jgi:hypothetical protein
MTIKLSDIAMGRLFISVVVAILGSLLGVVLYRREQPTQRLSDAGRSMRSATKPLKVVTWDPDTAIDKEAIIQLGEPVLLRGTFTSKWKALAKWNASYLGRALGKLPDVSLSSHDTFVTPDWSPAMHDGALDKEAPYIAHQTRSMEAVEFFEKTRSNSSHDTFFYYYGRLDQPELLQDVFAPGRDLFLHASDRGHQYIWLSSQGVRPCVHFDSDHNFFVHISGEKHFYLWPPWMWHVLSPYPRVSRLWHKSGCDFSASNETLDRVCPNWRKARSLVAVLEPGDVLYVPPYWWHQPLSVSPSISIATWSQASIWPDHLRHIYYSREFAFMDASLGFPERSTLLNRFFVGIFQVLYGRSLAEMARLCLETRWWWWWSSSSVQGVFSCEFAAELNRDLVAKVEQDSRFVAESFQGILSEANPEGNYKRAIMSFEVFDFVERMIARALGPSHVGLWLECCLR